MKKEQHLAVSLVFFALLLFEVIVFNDILGHPYMVALCLFLGCVGGYHLGGFFSKSNR